MSNPLLDDTGCHVATARLRFVGGRMQQLWMPADAATHAPEWRDVESVTLEHDTPPEGAGADRM